MDHRRPDPARGCGPPVDRGPSRRRPGCPRPGTRARPGSCRTSAAAAGRCSRSLRPRSPRPTASGSTAWIWARVSTSASPQRCRAAASRSALDLGLAAGDDPVDEAHDVEGGAVDGIVGAQAQRRGHGHPGRAQGGDDPVLAAHVVGGREHVARSVAAAARSGCRRRHGPRRSGCCDRRRPGGTAAGGPPRECCPRTRR